MIVSEIENSNDGDFKTLGQNWSGIFKGHSSGSENKQQWDADPGGGARFR